MGYGFSQLREVKPFALFVFYFEQNFLLSDLYLLTILDLMEAIVQA